ncbi:hypothetical protein WLV07_00005, partial [Bordetella bronchiseptica]
MTVNESLPSGCKFCKSRVIVSGLAVAETQGLTLMPIGAGAGGFEKCQVRGAGLEEGVGQVRSKRGRLDKLKKLLHNLVSLLLKTQRRSEGRVAGPLFNNLTTDKCGHLVRAHDG